MQAVKATRQNGTPEGPGGDNHGRKDVGHKRGKRNKVKRETVLKEAPTPDQKDRQKKKIRART